MNKTKILVVDDIDITVRGYTRELKGSGYDVFGALSGKEALEIAQKEKPDIVFTDLIMSKMDGVELCKKIKEINPKSEVVLISGYHEEAIKHLIEFIEAGGREEWLRKPLAKKQLQKTVEKVINEHME